VRRGDVGDERVAWRTADALADPVDEAGNDDELDRRGEGEERLGEGRHAVADYGEQLALAKVVADCLFECGLRCPPHLITAARDEPLGC